MPKEKKQITFRRIRGRIVPIRVKRKEDVQALAKFSGAGAIGLTTAFFGAKALKQSNKLFNQAALLRGTRRLGQPGSATSMKLAARANKVSRAAAKKLVKSRFSVFGGALAASILASSAIGDVLAPRVNEETKEAIQTVGAVGAALGSVALFGKATKLRGFKASLKASVKSGSPDEQVGILFGKFSKEGSEKTRRLIEKFARSKRKDQMTFSFMKKPPKK